MKIKTIQKTNKSDFNAAIEEVYNNHSYIEVLGYQVIKTSVFEDKRVSDREEFEYIITLKYPEPIPWSAMASKKASTRLS